MKKLYPLLSILFLIYWSCIPKSLIIPPNLRDINKDDYEFKYIGEKVEFVETYQKMLKYYKSQEPWIDSNGKEMSYQKLVGKKGKLDWIKFERKSYLSYYRWYKVTLDDGIMLYNKRYSSLKHPSDKKWRYISVIHGYIEKVFILSEYEEIKNKYLNKTIWIKEPKFFSILKPNPVETYDLFDKWSEVIVDDVIPYDGGGPPFYFFKLKSKDGNKSGYIQLSIPTRKVRYFDENPFNDDWDGEIINLIKSEKIRIGMTKYQVRLSWGKPWDINLTTTSYGSREQWVYDRLNYDNDYVYFENGKVVGIQN